jgi:hypothetical protein
MLKLNDISGNSHLMEFEIPFLGFSDSKGYEYLGFHFRNTSRNEDGDNKRLNILGELQIPKPIR